MHYCDHALSVVLRPSSVVVNFSHSSTSSLKLLNRIQRHLIGSKISKSSTKCVFFRPIRKKDGHPGQRLAETFSSSPLTPLNVIQQNLTGRKISTSSTKFVVFSRSEKTRWKPWPIRQKGGTLYSGARCVAVWAVR